MFAPPSVAGNTKKGRDMNWKAIDTSKARYLGTLEVEDSEGDLTPFEVLETDTHIVFGGMCNVGFIESGHIEREDYESIDETLQEMHEDLQVYYRDGAKYASRIVCNERM